MTISALSEGGGVWDQTRPFTLSHLVLDNYRRDTQSETCHELGLLTCCIESQSVVMTGVWPRWKGPVGLRLIATLMWYFISVVQALL